MSKASPETDRNDSAGEDRAPAAKPWFDRPELVRQFPTRFKLYAAYCRLLADRETGRVRGGSFLFRWMSRLGRLTLLPKTQVLRVAGRTLYVDLMDSRMLWALGEVEGEGPEGRIIRDELGSGDSFVDLGANHGAFSVLAAHRVGPQGYVLAVEPQARLADLVGRSLAAGPAGENRVHAVAVGDRDGEIPLYVPADHSGSAGVFASFSGAGRHRVRPVPLRRLDDLPGSRLLRGRVLMKIDVEGSEAAVLRGAVGVLRQHRPRILLELNPESAAAAGGSIDELLELLDELGYRRFATMESYPKSRPADALDRTIQQNVVAFPDDEA